MLSMEEELTPEQQSVLNSFKDPDAPSQAVQYDFDKSVQQDILALMIYKRSFMVQAMHLIKSEYFADKAHRLLCRVLKDWFETHIKGVTGQGEDWVQIAYLRDQLGELTKDDKHKSYYLAELATILDEYVPDLTSSSYCMERVVTFAKEQEVRIALAKTVEVVKSRDKDKFDKIKTLWDRALIVGPQMDLGLNYFETVEERYERMAKDREGRDRFSSGFDEIDLKISGVGLSRGEIGGFQANSGVGKSFLLCHAAKINLKRGHRVLFLTLEMNQDKTAERFDTLFCGINMKDLLANKSFVKHQLSAEIKLIKKSFNISDEDKNRLIVKHFAAGTADVNVIKAYYSQIAIQGFKPDLVIVDYIGELKDIPGLKTYESRQRLMRDLRTFGVEEGHCTLTAVQSNRMGRTNAEEMAVNDDSEISDSYGQARIMDAIWSINVSKREKKAGVGRIFVVKHRNGESRFMTHFSQDKNTLAIQSISEIEWKDRVSSVKPDPKESDNVVGELLGDDGTGGFKKNGGL